MEFYFYVASREKSRNFVRMPKVMEYELFFKYSILVPVGFGDVMTSSFVILAFTQFQYVHCVW